MAENIDPVPASLKHFSSEDLVLAVAAAATKKAKKNLKYFAMRSVLEQAFVTLCNRPSSVAERSYLYEIWKRSLQVITKFLVFYSLLNMQYNKHTELF